MTTPSAQRRLFAAIGALFMALAVGAGALGAHALQHLLEPPQLASFETAVRYQAWHALATILVQAIPEHWLNARRSKAISLLFVIGMVLFSWSIFLLSTRGLYSWGTHLSWLGPITPTGGLCLIAAWIWLAFSLAVQKGAPSRT
jgi:uncharacterized membrane protein YgdD (TMEM256/DUF423 family)